MSRGSLLSPRAAWVRIESRRVGASGHTLTTVLTGRDVAENACSALPSVDPGTDGLVAGHTNLSRRGIAIVFDTVRQVRRCQPCARIRHRLLDPHVVRDLNEIVDFVPAPIDGVVDTALRSIAVLAPDLHVRRQPRSGRRGGGGGGCFATVVAERRQPGYIAPHTHAGVQRPRDLRASVPPYSVTPVRKDLHVAHRG